MLLAAIVRPSGNSHIGQTSLTSTPEHCAAAGASPTIDRRMDQSAVAQPATLLEREHELERVRAALRAVGQRAGGVLVIEGAAGMGKSRLLEEARVRASELGVRVLSARATELEQGFPFGVVRQLFERTLLEADAGERDRWLAGAAALAGGACSAGAPARRPGAVVGASAGDPGYAWQHGLYWLASNLSADSPLAAGGRRPAVVRRAVGARARVHRAPARGAAAGADPRDPAARSGADARDDDAGCRSRRGACCARRR